MEEMNLCEFAVRFSDGEFKSKDMLTQCRAGWYDWWCKDSALAKKTEYLGKKVLTILGSDRFNASKSYVFFKNNCPMIGKLYDQFSICDIKSGDVLFCCQHLEKGSHGCEKAHWELYDREVGFEKPVVNGTWRDVYNYFKNNK